jgi:SPP1 gp7 family putative phage head morphogenesis protein
VTDYDVSALLEDTTGRLALEYERAFGDLLVALVLRNRPQAAAARASLLETVREARGRAEVLGAFSALRTASREAGLDRLPAVAARAERGRLLAFAETPAEKVLTRVTFAEALEDLRDRVPVTFLNAAERTAARIAQEYATADGRGVIAFAKAAEEKVTERARDLITQAVRSGVPESRVGRDLVWDVEKVRGETAAWTASYARLAFRTNLADATSRGRLKVARDPDVAPYVPALRYSAIGDSDTRSNHLAADGVVLPADSTEWRWLRPPLGYNCRCSAQLVTRSQLAREGRLDKAGKVIPSRIPSGARPDDGFRPGGPA